jgi:hypothetical protein
MSIQVLHADNVVGPIEFIIPSNETWTVMAGHIILISSATGGNRWLRMGTHDENDHIVQESHAGAKQGSSLERHYNLITGTNRETAFVDDEIEMGIPNEIVLLPTWTLRLQDIAEIDLTNDIFYAHIMIERSAGSDRRRKGF